MEQNISKVEVVRRFPEVLLINDRNIRDETIEALTYAPDYFWNMPASTSGKFHSPMARHKHGLWIHNKMAFTHLMRLAPSRVNQGLIAPYEVDYAMSAMLLHDMFKQGLEPEGHTTDDHDIVAATWLKEHTNLPIPVTDAVEAHNGPWGEGREPHETMFPEISRLVHDCDMSASMKDSNFGLYRPAKEIRELYGMWITYQETEY